MPASGAQGVGRISAPQRAAGDGDAQVQAQAGQCALREGKRPPKAEIRLVQELAVDGFSVEVTCRIRVTSTYYEATGREPSAGEVEDRDLLGLVGQVHEDSRDTYGAPPRIHAELRMGLGLKVGRKRLARLMRGAGIHGVSHRRKRRHRPEWPPTMTS